MKKIKYLTVIPVAIVLLLVIQACKKGFLDKPALGALSQGTVANKVGVQGLLIGAYHSLLGEINWGSAPSNWVFGSISGGDSYKGSVPSDQGDITPLEIWAYNANNPYLNDKWNGIYHGVQRANEVLRVVPLAADLSDAEKKAIVAEARFLRGFWHFEAKRVWNNVPYVDETVTVGNNNLNVSNVDASGNYVDIWPKIEADLQFAMDNLPETQGSAAGRANKWSAASFLAKAYMYEQKFAPAKALFDQIIANGKTAKGEKYKLVNYYSNFNAAQDNSAESIFAVQNSVNEGSGTNGNYGDNLQFPNGGGPGGCCGFNNPSISLANSYKTDAAGLPLFTTFNTTGGDVSAPTNAYTGNLDPRIDLVMGRVGVPYMDWGPYPKEAWIREPSTNGYFSPKKIVYAKAQQGSLSSTETSFWAPTQQSAINVNLMRYADVLLMAAEAEVQVGTLAKALDYVNQVRTRAADPTGWVYKSGDYDPATATYKTRTPGTEADKYKIAQYPAFPDKAYAMTAILFERKLELAMEGHRFFDLQRNDKLSPGLMANELNAFAAFEKNKPTPFAVNTATFTKGKNEFFPIPQGQIDLENATGTVALKQNPGY